MSKINFRVCGAEIEYELHDLGRSEHLRLNGELIIDTFGDVGAWGRDYHTRIAGLHGCAKVSAEQMYLKDRAESLIINEIFTLREMVRDLS